MRWWTRKGRLRASGLPGKAARRRGSWACWALWLCGVVPMAQGAGPAVVDAQVQQAAPARFDDADTLLNLTREGAVLYEADPVKLTGYQYCSQAVAMAEQGEFRLSVRAASKALHLALANQDPNLQALAHRDLAIAFNYAGLIDKAELHAREALKATAKEPAKVAGPAYKVLGDVLAQRGDFPGAVREYQEALRTASPRYGPLVQASLANALIESGDVGQARQVLDGMAAPEDPSAAVQLDRTRARLLLAEGRPALAAELYQSMTRGHVGVDSAYYQLWGWDGLARSETAQGNAAAAGKAYAQALDTVDAVRARFRSEEFKMGLFSSVQTVFDGAAAFYAKQDEPARAFDVGERSRSRALLDEVRHRARLPEEMTQAIDVASVQRLLAPDEAVVQFYALPDQLLVWVVDAQRIRMHRLPIGRENLQRLVQAFRDAVAGGRTTVVAGADALGNALLGPLGLPDGIRLIVVPHGPLHYLPFQALRLQGHYLIERHPVSIAPSISIAVGLARRTPRAPSDAVAFGNPRVGDEYELPAAAREAADIAALFQRGQAYTGTAATKTEFLEVAGRAPIVHVAAHALADPVDPLYSRILLANENGQRKFLEAHEINGLDLSRNRLVTLSACESGLGRVAQGDEVLGFPRSFLAAGSSTLIASFWPVSDDAAELLMRTLYQSLTQGKDVQRAMQAGQLAVLHTPGRSHPFFWAPFNVIGNWRLTVGN